MYLSPFSACHLSFFSLALFRLLRGRQEACILVIQLKEKCHPFSIRCKILFSICRNNSLIKRLMRMPQIRRHSDGIIEICKRCFRMSAITEEVKTWLKKELGVK